jgi:hypothetical protein
MKYQTTFLALLLVFVLSGANAQTGPVRILSKQ